ncbi:AAA family ATPase [Mycobacterium sp. 663a-19]|uniref:nucleotide-binding protein n=1 Tax=Mycobacterium sp. 663a-19 TaxID=2986148 RepID=UPI002D1E7A74|nr:AAA family ATPase [Mycobacterium sp. 663a-19]MEB3980184.1 AAA family ATPase [Mycobacterium sp. 663a-19]
MTSPHEREERDFFDDLSDGESAQRAVEPQPYNGQGDDQVEEPQAGSDPRAAQTEMIPIDKLPPGVGRPATSTPGGPREQPRFAPPAEVFGGAGEAPTGDELRRPAVDQQRRYVSETSHGTRQLERPQFPPPLPAGWSGGRHGTPERAELNNRGGGPWAAQTPQGWQEPPFGVRRHGEARSGNELRDKLRATDLIAPRKIESSTGWRKALYAISFGLINVGESADEQKVRALKAAVNANVRGTYSIVVLGGKGGVGKTVLTASIASLFANLRRNDRVVAIDADPAQAANLATRVDPKAASMREINSDTNLNRYADVRALTGQNAVGLDVVASPRHAGVRGEALDANEFNAAHTRLQRFYSVLFVDCGVDLDHKIMAGVLDRADAVMMVASAVPDGAEGASTNFEWLRDGGYHQLLTRTVLLINHIRPPHNRKDRKTRARLVGTMTEHFKHWVPEQRIIEVPFDAHIATAGIVELSELNPATERKVLEAAAALAAGFAAGAEAR